MTPSPVNPLGVKGAELAKHADSADPDVRRLLGREGGLDDVVKDQAAFAKLTRRILTDLGLGDEIDGLDRVQDEDVQPGGMVGQEHHRARRRVMFQIGRAHV